MINEIKDKDDAEELLDNLSELSVSLGFQMMNGTLPSAEADEENNFEDLKENTTIVKSTTMSLGSDYKNWFAEKKKVPVPAVSLEKIAYTDYGKFDDDDEQKVMEKKDVNDIFRRDGTNYVKDDILLNLLKKMNKN